MKGYLLFSALFVFIISCNKNDVLKNDKKGIQKCPEIIVGSPKRLGKGDTVPEISILGPDQECKALSSLKGKVVILSFWASWSAPCRRTNTDIAEVYNRYKEQDLEVFSVSLDGVDDRKKEMMADEEYISEISRAKKSWIQAIADDSLTWTNHGCELQKWDGQTPKNYAINSIPKVYILSRDGVINAIDPGHLLEQEIVKLL